MLQGNKDNQAGLEPGSLSSKSTNITDQVGSEPRTLSPNEQTNNVFIHSVYYNKWCLPRVAPIIMFHDFNNTHLCKVTNEMFSSFFQVISC